jgi:hypothetical protein
MNLRTRIAAGATAMGMVSFFSVAAIAGSDSPQWIEDGGTLTRNIAGATGDVQATFGEFLSSSFAGTMVWQLASLHGVTAVTLPDDPTQALQAVPLAGEFGVPNPTTGRSRSPDPAVGGNANTDPTDPIRMYDLDGLRARNYAEAEHLGQVVALYTIKTGGSCKDLFGLRTCSAGWGHAYGRGGTTLGTTFVVAAGSRNVSATQIEHEKVHRAQWRYHGYAFALLYLHAGSNPCRNRFEIEAGLVSGGYSC